MLAGKKPAAMFAEALQCRDIIPEAEFEPYVKAGRIMKAEYRGTDKTTGIPFVRIYYALPEEPGELTRCKESTSK